MVPTYNNPFACNDSSQTYNNPFEGLPSIQNFDAEIARWRAEGGPLPMNFSNPNPSSVLLHSIQDFDAHINQPRITEGQLPLEFSSFSVENLIDNSDHISEDVKDALKTQFPYVKFFDCRRLYDSLENIVDKTHLKDLYKGVTFASHLGIDSDTVIQYLEKDARNAIKDDAKWVLGIYTLLLDNSVASLKEKIDKDPSIHFPGSRFLNRSKHCLLAWVLCEGREKNLEGIKSAINRYYGNLHQNYMNLSQDQFKSHGLSLLINPNLMRSLPSGGSDISNIV